MASRKTNTPSFWLAAAGMAAVIGLALVLERRAGPAQLEREQRPFGEKQADEEPHALQLTRARQRGRGRQAPSPLQIPWTGWKDILLRTWQQIGADRLLAVAAGVVFYGLLALFPAITALVSSYGLFADAASIGGHLAVAAAFLPAGAFSIVQEQVDRIVQASGGELGLGFVFGLLLAVWSANAGMKAMIDALNVIYDEDEKRGFIALNLLSLALTVAVLAVILLAIGMVVVFPLALNFVGLGNMQEWVATLLRWPLLFIMLTLALAVLYRFGPSRRQAHWQWLSPGAVIATLLWIAGSALLSLYLSNFADYNATYGSLGAGIGLMMWLWLTSMVILLGAELNSEIEHQTARDTTTGRPKPLGSRGATMADTVGAAQT